MSGAVNMDVSYLKNKSGIMSRLFQKERDVLDKLVVIEDRKKRA